MSIFKNSWVQEQYELVQAANKPVKKHETECLANCMMEKNKLLDIPKGILVFLQDHPDGCNNIQDRYKEFEFVMI